MTKVNDEKGRGGCEETLKRDTEVHSGSDVWNSWKTR